MKKQCQWKSTRVECLILSNQTHVSWLAIWIFHLFLAMHFYDRGRTASISDSWNYSTNRNVTKLLRVAISFYWPKSKSAPSFLRGTWYHPKILYRALLTSPLANHSTDVAVARFPTSLTRCGSITANWTPITLGNYAVQSSPGGQQPWQQQWWHHQPPQQGRRRRFEISVGEG